MASCRRAMVERNRGAATPKTDQVAQGADSKTPGLATQRESGPNCHSSPRRGSLKSAWVACVHKGREPKDPSCAKGIGPRTPLRKIDWRRGAFSLLLSCCGNCCAVAIVVALEEGEVPGLSRLPKGRGVGLWNGITGGYAGFPGTYGYIVFIEVHSHRRFDVHKRPGPFGDRGDTPQ